MEKTGNDLTANQRTLSELQNSSIFYLLKLFFLIFAWIQKTFFVFRTVSSGQGMYQERVPRRYEPSRENIPICIENEIEILSVKKREFLKITAGDFNPTTANLCCPHLFTERYLA